MRWGLCQPKQYNRLDARTIATMLMSDVDLKSYTDTAYHNEELKSLTRYRFDKVKERAKLKQSISRLVTILFPELEKLVPTLHMASVYALLSEFPGAKQLAGAHLTHLKTVLSDVSRGRYGRDMATELRDAAKRSVGSVMPAKSLELQHTIRLIRELDAEIKDIEAAIEAYLAKKRAEGKHYNVAISHAAKKLVRLIYAMGKSRQPYNSAA